MPWTAAAPQLGAVICGGGLCCHPGFSCPCCYQLQAPSRSIFLLPAQVSTQTPGSLSILVGPGQWFENILGFCNRFLHGPPLLSLFQAILHTTNRVLFLSQYSFEQNPMSPTGHEIQQNSCLKSPGRLLGRRVLESGRRAEGTRGRDYQLHV